MTIGNDPTLRVYLDKLLSQLDANVFMSDIWIDFLLSPDALCEADAFITYQKKHKLNSKETYQHLFIHAIEGETPFPINSFVKEGIKAIDVSMYKTNPYYQTVKPTSKAFKEWEITYDYYLPYQGFLYGDVQVKPTTFFQEITPIGFSEQPFSYLAIKQDSVTWMSVTPFEIETMQPILNTVKGHVVALGLGLGYFAFMAALKADVTHVTIVEKDEKAIKLFHENLFPFFPHASKITVIHQDAFDYLSTQKENVDHMFVDIYHTAEDGLPLYIRMKPYEATWVKTTWSYWLETSILARYRRLMLVVLDQVIRGNKKPTFNEFDEDIRLQLRHLYKDYASLTIHTIDELNAWLSDASIKKSFFAKN